MSRSPGLAPLVALAAVVAGCSAPEPSADPAPAEAPPATAADPEAAGPQRPRQQHPGGVGHWAMLAAAAREALDTPGPDGRTPDFVDSPLSRGEHLEVSLIAARGRVPAPSRAADEVLIVVQGPFEDEERACGVLQVAGRPRQLTPGTVALLPAGSRGALEPARSRGDKPLLAIVARALKAGGGAPTGEPWVADLAALDPQLKPEPYPEPEIRPVASLGGRIGLYVLALSINVLEAKGDPSVPLQERVASRITAGVLPPRVHAAHDEALLLLLGEGNLTLGRTSHRVQGGSIVLVPAGLEFCLTSDAPRPGTRALVISAPATAGEDVRLLPN